MYSKFKNSQIKKNNLSETIARELEKMILEGEIEIGEKLPPETELAELFGVSRNILREALVGLKERELVKVKTGQGAYVVKPKGNIINETIERLVKLHEISAENIYEARMALEVTATGLATKKASNQDIIELKKIMQEMRTNNDVEKWIDIEQRFHMTIVNIAGNPLFSIFIRQLFGVLVGLFTDIFSVAKEEAINDHERIFKMIEAQDVDQARKAMQLHLEHSQKKVFTFDKN